MKQEFDALLEKLKTERDEMQLKMHLASMEVKEEFLTASHHVQFLIFLIMHQILVSFI